MDKFGVPYQKMVQEEREIIIVFPYAYHSGFNHGFNIAESTNFATERWIEFGKRQRPCDCDRARVRFSMDPFILKYHGEEALDKWKNNLDIAPHPFDPPDVAEKILKIAENPEKWAMEQAEKKRKQEEKKLRQYELKKLQREEREKEMAAAAKAKSKIESEKKLVKEMETKSNRELLHVYKLKGVEDSGEIEIDPETMTILSGRKHLEDHLKTKDFKVKELVNQEVIYKDGEKKICIKRKASNADLESEKQPPPPTKIVENQVTEKKTVAMYKHCANENLHITVDPVTKELTSMPTKDLVSFLKDLGEDFDIQTLIEQNIFTKICDCIMEVKKVKRIIPKEVVTQPEVKKAKEEATQLPVSPKKRGPGTNMTVYRHRETGEHITLSVNFKPIGRAGACEKIKAILEGMSPKDMVDEGLLVQVGSKKPKVDMDHAIFKHLLDEKERKIEIASMDNMTVFSYLTDKEISDVLQKADNDFVLLENDPEFRTARNILDELLTLSGVDTDQEPNLEDIERIKEILGPQVTIESGWNIIDEEAGRSYMIMSKAMPGHLFEPPARIEEEDETETETPRKKKVSLYPESDSDLDTTNDKSAAPVDDNSDIFSDEEEELFTDDVSSESNDESSDDPDYFGKFTGFIG